MAPRLVTLPLLCSALFFSAPCLQPVPGALFLTGIEKQTPYPWLDYGFSALLGPAAALPFDL
jgi:hypothetical protein